ncbi:hypothetical protein [Nocardia paucivorans]|uniref:hypothetical protein n=1 Tax=Nocardia paucivorans TaxID=114259 RepID=UPI0002EC3882|nr:hypothetical protein [Nocardia paucivorans]
MSYDHILLPSGVASTSVEVDAYLTAQRGRPETDEVAAIAAEVNARNAELPEEDSFLSTAPIGGIPTGSTLYVPSPYDAIGFARALLFDLATPRDYALYDPQLAWLIDPTDHIPLTVTLGGAGEFPYLTKALAGLWVRELADPNPYLIAERAEQVYIQTYRLTEDQFALEYRDGGPDRHFGTTVTGADTVAALIWDWATGDRTRLDALAWSRPEL